MDIDFEGFYKNKCSMDIQRYIFEMWIHIQISTHNIIYKCITLCIIYVTLIAVQLNELILDPTIQVPKS